MRARPSPFVRVIIALACLFHAGLGLAACFGPHGKSAAHGYLCGQATPSNVAALADIVPEVFSEAYRQLTGSGEDCCSACPACGCAVLPASAAGPGAESAPAFTSALAAARVASRFGVRKPPSTAPPTVS